MASLRLRSLGGPYLRRRRPPPLSLTNSTAKVMQSQRTCSSRRLVSDFTAHGAIEDRTPASSSFSISGDHRHPVHSETTSSDGFPGRDMTAANKNRRDHQDEIPKRLDHWVRESIVQIVNSLDEAPFLVHIYTSDDGGPINGNSTASKRLVREKAAPGSWPLVKERWDRGTPTPDGVMLVQELEDGEIANEMLDFHRLQVPTSTKVWGILVQGKGVNGVPCYLLRTCRVPSVSGYCTHFCLARVECFVEHADVLLKNVWLQGS